MTTRPRIATEGNWLAGLAAGALFAVMAAVFLGADLPNPVGFPGEGSITASIGYAMFNIDNMGAYPSEQFLVAFEIIDIVLVAALVGAVMLARREEGSVTGALTDGGQTIRRSLRDDDEGGDD